MRNGKGRKFPICSHSVRQLLSICHTLKATGRSRPAALCSQSILRHLMGFHPAARPAPSRTQLGPDRLAEGKEAAAPTGRPTRPTAPGETAPCSSAFEELHHVCHASPRCRRHLQPSATTLRSGDCEKALLLRKPATPRHSAPPRRRDGSSGRGSEENDGERSAARGRALRGAARWQRAPRGSRAVRGSGARRPGAARQQ